MICKTLAMGVREPYTSSPIDQDAIGTEPQRAAQQPIVPVAKLITRRQPLAREVHIAKTMPMVEHEAREGKEQEEEAKAHPQPFVPTPICLFANGMFYKLTY